MNKKLFMLLILAAVLFPSGIRAQVLIGGSGASTDEPTAGAILDLNGAVKGGLVLSNVVITDLGKIPTGTDGLAGITAGTDDDTNEALTGTMVYNTGEGTTVAKGAYVWDGTDWATIGGETVIAPPEGCNCTVGSDGYLYARSTATGNVSTSAPACPAGWSTTTIWVALANVSSVELAKNSLAPAWFYIYRDTDYSPQIIVGWSATRTWSQGSYGGTGQIHSMCRKLP
ncbi:MAG: hypothetical protein LBO74_04985 [Candidatus Symbiothrix sp.]|jgi:hypothetical protein|nr:hypothetical protein [Candidatus Symbiothrix sp.]